MRDLRYRVRSSFAHRFCASIRLALALGIGPTHAIFSVVNAAPFSALPSRFLAPRLVWDQLVKLGLDRFPVSYANYLDYRTENGVFQDVASFAYAEFNRTAGDQA
jgi:hypothetical protein